MSDFQPIGSFAKVRRGASPRPIGDPRYFGGNVGWVRISDVTQRNKKFLRQTEQYLSPLGESRSLRVDKGDLIMSICATVGKPMIVDMAACIHDGFVQIYDIVDADTEYLYYLLQFHEKDFEKRGQPGTQVNLNTTIVENEVVYIPAKPQQQKIANMLSTVDKLIENTQTLIDKYTAIKQGMMADLFARGIDLSLGPDGTPASNSPGHKQRGGQLRPSVEDAPELYKQTELGWVPKEWEVKPLGDYLSMITYGFTNPMPETEVGPWMVTAANVVDGGIDYKKTRKTSLEAFNTLLTQKSKPKLGDILLTKDGTLGRLAIVDNEYLCINQSVALLRCNESAKPEFLKLLLETEKYYQKMLDDAGGSTIKHIYITIVDKMLLAMPSSEEEQVAIFTKANAINEKIKIEENNLEKYSKLKKGLMQDLLTGKVKVK